MEAQSRRAAAAAGVPVSTGVDAESIIARAMYIWEVTRREPHWGDWVDQSDNSLASPEVGRVLGVCVFVCLCVGGGG